MFIKSTVPFIYWDETIGEPYLALPSHPDLRITPFRDTSQEEEAMITLYNDAAVGKWSFRRPFPYNRACSRWKLDQAIPGQSIAVALLHSIPVGKIVADLPFTVIRHTPSGRMVGCVDMWPGDETTRVRWEVAYDLLPELHGRGIIREALSEIISWASVGLAEMEAVFARVETNNIPSTKTVERSGFTRGKPIMVDWPVAKGGGMRELVIWELNLGNVARAEEDQDRIMSEPI